MPSRRRPAWGSPPERAFSGTAWPVSGWTRRAPSPSRAGRRGQGREGAARARTPSTALLGLGQQPLALHAGALQTHRAAAPGILLPPAVLFVLQDQRRHFDRASLLVLRHEGEVGAADVRALAGERVLALDTHPGLHRGA